MIMSFLWGHTEQKTLPEILKRINKANFSHAHYRAQGPELILVYRKSARRWLSHPLGGRLPLLSAMAAVSSRQNHLYMVARIWFQLTIHLSTQKDERLSWPGWLTCSGQFTHNSGHPSEGQGKFAGQRSMFYHCAMQPTRLRKTVRL